MVTISVPFLSFAFTNASKARRMAGFISPALAERRPAKSALPPALVGGDYRHASNTLCASFFCK